MTLYKGDNLQAFDGQPIEINVELEEGTIVSKAQFVINEGVIVKEFENPTFPVYAELDEKDTIKLSFTNEGRLILYDAENRKLTCDGVLKFRANKEVYVES